MYPRKLIVLFVVFSLMAWGGVLAQDDETPDLQDEIQLTVNAGVEARFTQTAEATRNFSLIQTIDASVYNALTATDAELIPTLTAVPALTLTAVEEVIGAVVVASELLNVSGGTYDMGTTPPEIGLAVQICVNEQAGNCTIQMGDDSLPQHSVTLNPFLIEATEVTYQQYVDFLNLLGDLKGCNGMPCAATLSESESSNLIFEEGRFRVAPQILDFPVANVTWHGADAYCRALGRRLPTEAEWELAARGFEGRIYPWGADWNPDLAKTSIPEIDESGALPVSSYIPGASPFGALNMAGNVAEWVADWYDPTFYAQPAASGLNPLGPAGGDQKVIRGGSWDAKPFFARSVHRQSLAPTGSGAWLGFRCAADLPVEMPLAAITPSVTKTATVYTQTPTLTPTPVNTPTRDPRVTPSPTATPT